MVDVTTLEATAVQLPANDTVLAPPAIITRQERRRRILALRDGIASGEYRVAACDLADAMLRACRRAN